MLDYARSDTHFLLFVYDNMRNELIDRSEPARPDGSLVDVVLKASKEEALQRYEWPFYDETRGLGSNGWNKLLSRTPALFTKEQFAVFRAVHQWRDAVARGEDESVHYIMPKHVIYNIATSLPIDMPSLLGVSHPISQSLRSRADTLLDIIKQAKEAGANGPEMVDVLQLHPTKAGESVNPNSSSTVMRASTILAAETTSAPHRAPGELPFRTDSSQFWGSIFGSSLWQAPKQVVPVSEGLRLAIPLPQLTAEVFSNGTNGPTDTDNTRNVDAGAPPEHQYQKVRDSRTSSDDGIFVIRQMGGARKRKMSNTQEQAVSPAQSNSLASEAIIGNAGDIEGQSEILLEDEEMRNRLRKKAERKAQKKLKKEQAQAMKGTKTIPDFDRDMDQPVEPFDYANAESVLHAKRDLNDRSTPKKAFDPYSKSMDAPKGMRKTKREIPGKSFTFEN